MNPGMIVVCWANSYVQLIEKAADTERMGDHQSDGEADFMNDYWGTPQHGLTISVHYDASGLVASGRVEAVFEFGDSENILASIIFRKHYGETGWELEYCLTGLPTSVAVAEATAITELINDEFGASVDWLAGTQNVGHLKDYELAMQMIHRVADHMHTCAVSLKE